MVRAATVGSGGEPGGRWGSALCTPRQKVALEEGRQQTHGLEPEAQLVSLLSGPSYAPGVCRLSVWGPIRAKWQPFWVSSEDVPLTHEKVLYGDKGLGCGN